MFSCTRFADLQQFIWTRLYSLLKNLQKFTRFTQAACQVAPKFPLNTILSSFSEYYVGNAPEDNKDIKQNIKIV